MLHQGIEDTVAIVEQAVEEVFGRITAAAVELIPFRQRLRQGGKIYPAAVAFDAQDPAAHSLKVPPLISARDPCPLSLNRVLNPNKEQIEKSVSYGVLSSLECSPKRCIPPARIFGKLGCCIIRD